MQQNLQGLFERALDDEPVPPPGDLTRAAMAQGRRIRRRRGLLAGGSAAAVAVATMVALNLALAPPAPPVPTAATDPACTSPVREDVSDVSIFLTADITESQRADLDAALRVDPFVRDLRYESREEAYARFKELWQSDPDMTRGVSGDALPESFRIRLADPSEYPAFAARFQDRDGVANLVGRLCPGATK